MEYIDPQKARQERERLERERQARLKAERDRKARIEAEKERQAKLKAERDRKARLKAEEEAAKKTQKAEQKDPDKKPTEAKKPDPKLETKKPTEQKADPKNPKGTKKPDEKTQTDITWSKAGEASPIYGPSSPIHNSISPLYGQPSVPIAKGSEPKPKPEVPLDRSPRTWTGEKVEPEPEPYQKADLSRIRAKIAEGKAQKEQKKQEQRQNTLKQHPGIQNILNPPPYFNSAIALGVAALNPALSASLLTGSSLLSPKISSTLLNGAMNLGQQQPQSTQSQLIAQAPRNQSNQPQSKAPTLTPGQSIATWGQLNRPLIVQPPIERTFETSYGATAYAQSLGQAAVVTQQGNRYVINPLTDDPKYPKGRFSFRREGLEDPTRPDLNIAKLRDVTPGLSAIVTQDGYQITDQSFQRQMMSISPDGKKTPMGEPRDITLPAFETQSIGMQFAGQREAYGVGLSNIKDKEQFLKQYKLSLRGTALGLLDTSAKEAKQKQALFAQGMPASEAPKINRVATSLEDIDKQIAEAKWNRVGADITAGQTNQGLGIASLFSDPAKKQFADQLNSQSAAHAQVQQLEQQRAALLTQYPLLSRVNPADFNKLTPQEQAKSLHEACGGVLSDIQTTRQNIIKDKLNLWQLAPLVATTTNGLGVQPEQMEWVAEKIKSDKTWDVASKVGMGVLSIGMAVGSTFVAGPLGTAMAWGAFGVGVGGAISETDQYFTNQAGANTSIDPNKSVVPQDMKGHWGWVAAAWVGAGLDLGAAVQATRMLKAGMEVDQAIKLLSAQHKIPAAELEAAYAIAKKGASDPKTLQKIMKSALPEKVAGQADDLLKSIKVLKPEEFTQKFGSETADAVTTFVKDKDGVLRAQVFFRQGGNPLSMREEAVHISQLAEGGDIAKKAALLTEENLSKWPKLSMEQRLDVYKAKIEVEIDAQKRLLQQFGQGDPRYVQQVKHNLENLQSRMSEVDLGVKNPKSVQDADWLREAQAPRLFSKEASIDFNSAEALRKDQIAHGGWYSRKKIRQIINDAEYSSHGSKHIKAKTAEEARQMSFKAAQYLPGVNNAALEKIALQKGTLVPRPNGAFWKIHRFDKPIGFDGGSETHWIRAEYSSGTYHGHPMSVDRVKKYIKDAENQDKL
jgi:hypothetical protein